VRVVGQPLTELSRLLIQPFDASAGFLGEVRFCRQGVVLAVAGQHDLSRRFEFLGLSGKISTGAAFGFTGVAREFDAINREHLASDQALPVAEVDHLGEELGDVFAQSGDKGGDGRKVRGAVTGERDEADVFSAQPLNPPAADDAFGVGAQDVLEQHSRRVGGGTCIVVAVATVKAR